MDLHAIDLLLVLLLVLAAVSGYRRGFAVVVLGYAGLLLGLALGAWAATRVGLFISAEDSLRRLLVGIVVFFLVAAVCHSLATRLGAQLRSALTGRVAGGLDAIGGAVAAIAMTAIAMWFVGLTLGSVPFSPVARAVSDSAVLRTLDRFAPRPPPCRSRARAAAAYCSAAASPWTTSSWSPTRTSWPVPAATASSPRAAGASPPRWSGSTPGATWPFWTCRACGSGP